MLMTFTALLLCQERRLIFLLRRILRASSQGGDDLKSSSNCHQVTNVSQEGAVMILPAHENYVSIPALPVSPPALTEWLPVISIPVSVSS